MEIKPGPDLRALLAHTAVFGHLNAHELDALAAEMAWLWLPGGAPLYLRGEASDALYLLKAGSMGVFGAPKTGGRARLLNLPSVAQIRDEVMTEADIGNFTGHLDDAIDCLAAHVCT